MVVAALLFATMGVCVKFASASFGAAELIFWRGVVGMVFMWALARSQGVRLRTAYPGMHAWRSGIGVVSMGAWFYSIAVLPLATAMTLNYMSSIWIAAFLAGAALVAWRPGQGKQPALHGALVSSVFVGFVGVVLLLRPTLAQDQLVAGMAGVFSGFTAAFAYLQVVALSRAGEPETRTVFYFAFACAASGGIAMLGGEVHALGWPSALWLLAIGVLAALAQLSMTYAYARAQSHGGTLVVANLQYSGIVFSAAYGIVLFDDVIAPSGWLGIGLIAASGIAATILRARAQPDAPAEEH